MVFSIFATSNSIEHMKSFNPQPWLLPQPVLILGTYNTEGKPNAMNVAWAGTWNMKQIVISLGNHQTTVNLESNPHFTLAFATQETMAAADYVGLVSGRNEPMKIKKSGLTPEKAPTVNAPLFKQLPMTFECSVSKVLDKSHTGCYLIADVLNILVDEKYLTADGKPDIEKMKLISFDPTRLSYVAFGSYVGKAYSEGKKLK